MKAFRRLTSVILLALGLFVVPAAPARADEGWSCSVPPLEYTYVAIRQLTGVCGSPWPVIQYDIRLPVDGLIACTARREWATSFSRASRNGCGINGFMAFQYGLATPAEGLQSCTIPIGWRAASTVIIFGKCGSGNTIVYRLTRA